VKLSFQALKRFVDFEGTPQECSDLLAGLGFPNDGSEEFAAALDQVVVGKILEKKAHPQADRLSLLKVSTGGASHPIVCGAKNMKEGDFIALAPVGAKLPSPDGEFEIKKAKIRGEVSEGMCCSESELGLSEESDGILILPAGAESFLGKPVSEFMPLKDVIFDIDVTPNRGDALNVRGLARELGAKIGQKLKPQKVGRWKSPASEVKVEIESYEDASAFVGCLIEGVQMSQTPEPWTYFLQAMGGRSISPLVDVTNVVLFELGHPVHFFDADKVDLSSMHVRRAKPGEKLELLDESLIELHPEDLVIADASGPLSLAGVMGGKASAVNASTESVLLEVACFDPKRIRASSRRHGISSESSFRFERGLTPHRIEEVVERVLGLLQEAGSYGRALGTKVWDRNLSPPSCLWNRQSVEGKLGPIKLTDDEIFSRLRALDYEFEGQGSSIQVVFPWYRSDGSMLEDVMEDVARLIGYENLHETSLQVQEGVSVHDDLQREIKAGRALIQDFNRFGFSEVLHPSFSGEELESFMSFSGNSAVRLKNPLHSERSILRRSLLPQLIERAKVNHAHGEEEIRLVEMGPVFSREGQSGYQNSPVSERWQIACIWNPRAVDEKRLWHSSVDPFYRFKGWMNRIFAEWKTSVNISALPPTSVFFPTRMDEKDFGVCGELHPAVAKQLGLQGRALVGEWSLQLSKVPRMFEKVPDQPPVDLDISLLVSNQISMQELIDAFEKERAELVEWVRPYDLYESKDFTDARAITLAVRYRDAERTLSMEEAQKQHQDLAHRVMKAFPEGQIAPR